MRNNTMAKRDYFTFYRSYYEQISDCDDPNARLEMYEVLLNYAFNKIEPDFKKGEYQPMTRFFWKGAKAVMEKNWAQYENGCKGGAPIGNTNNKGKKKVNPKLTQSQAYKDKEEDKEIDKDIEGEREEDVFRPPSLEEVLSYFSSTYGADGDGVAKKFFYYYEANGWKVSNGATMADWRAALDSWCLREPEFKNQHHRNNSNNEKDKSATEQCGAELGQREYTDKARNDGEGRGLDDNAW